MFNSVINAPDIRERRLGTGAILSITTHAVIFAVLLYGSTHKPLKTVAPPEVMLKVASPPPPPPPLGGPSRVQPVSAKPVVARNALVITKDPPKPTPTAEESSPEPASAGSPSEPGGKEGVPNGSPTGVPGGTGTTTPTAPPAPPPPPVNAVIPFGAGMNRPTLVSGPRPVYPREAREAKVEGTMLVRCVITTAGTLRSCRVLKSLPFMEQPVLEALAAQRYTPVTFQGRPVDVEYVIPFKFTLEP